MAVEVNKGRFLFANASSVTPPRPSISGNLDEIVKRMLKRDEKSVTIEPQTTTAQCHSIGSLRPPPFFYNPTHDLESLFWIAIYFLVNKETSSDGNWQPLTKSQVKYAQSLFYDFSSRIEAIIIVQYNPLEIHLESLPRHLLPICERLIRLRQRLREHYDSIEKPGYKITKDVCQTLYHHFLDAFEAIEAMLTQKDVIIADLGKDPRSSNRHTTTQLEAEEPRTHIGSTSSSKVTMEGESKQIELRRSQRIAQVNASSAK